MPTNNVQWLRQRTLGFKKTFPTSTEAIKQLKLESQLDGHQGCVNCLEWNASGNLLASGSDDRCIIIWDPFRGTKRGHIKTSHTDNIFSVKFIPKSCDSLIASSASDSSLKVTNLLTNSPVVDCRECHRGRVKRIATHHNEPNLVWSAGEEGWILQYDLRESHRCQTKPVNLLFDLKEQGNSAKCLAINPVNDKQIAVGSNDVFVRIFDRRYKSGCSFMLSPGHLSASEGHSSLSLGATYLAYNHNGSELLVSSLGEQIYLYNLFDMAGSYKSFNQSALPMFFKSLPSEGGKQAHQRPSRKLMPHPIWKKIKAAVTPVPQKAQIFCKILESSLKTKSHVALQNMDHLNELILENEKCLDLYNLRARALMNRNWKGDTYQALRDSCCALALDPSNIEALSNVLRLAEAVGIDKPADVNRLNYLDHGEEWLSKWLVIDYAKRFCGHCNVMTDIKECNFFGSNSEFIVAGSDDGAFYLWDKKTTNIVKAVNADSQVLNCVQPHPDVCLLATSGVDTNVKLWSPNGDGICDVSHLDSRTKHNANFISRDPFEAMIMMLSPNRDTFSDD